VIAGLGLTFALSASAATITEFIRAFVQERPYVPGWLQQILAFSPTQRAISMGGVMFFLTALLWILPESGLSLGVSLLCGALGSVLWEVAKWGFTFYVFKVARTSYFYGSLSAMMIFLLWIYYSTILMLWIFELAHVLSGGQNTLQLQTRRDLESSLSVAHLHLTQKAGPKKPSWAFILNLRRT